VEISKMASWDSISIGGVMQHLRGQFFALGTLVGCFINLFAYAQPSNHQNAFAASRQKEAISEENVITQRLRIGIVNTKKCIDNSKLGKQEQANFEKMKDQMKSVLEEKGRALEDIESKLNDDDYMDTLSDEAAGELKRKKRTLRNEGVELEGKYMQALQQASMRSSQRLTDTIGKASAQIAQEALNIEPIDVIFTDEACTFYSPRLDVSDRIIAKMNAIFDAEQKETPSKRS